MSCSTCGGPSHPGQPCPPENQRRQGSVWVFNDQLYVHDDDGWIGLTSGGIDNRWHPMQPIELDEQGTIRFRKNKIVRLLLETSHLDLSSLKIMLDEGMVSQEDYTHLMQLIGYSVSGYGSLSTSPTELVEEADRQAAVLLKIKDKRE